MESEITLTNTIAAKKAFSLLKSATKASLYPVGSRWSLKDLEYYCINQQIIVTNLNHQAVGFVCFLPINLLTIEILLIALEPKYWGKGLMRSSLLKILHNYNEVWLEVHEQNLSAKQLYLSLGFEITGKRLNYYKDDGAALVMRYKKS